MDRLSFLEVSVEVNEELVSMVVLLRLSFLIVLLEEAELEIAMAFERGGGVNCLPLVMTAIESD